MRQPTDFIIIRAKRSEQKTSLRVVYNTDATVYPLFPGKNQVPSTYHLGVMFDAQQELGQDLVRLLILIETALRIDPPERGEPSATGDELHALIPSRRVSVLANLAVSLPPIPRSVEHWSESFIGTGPVEHHTHTTTCEVYGIGPLRME